MIKLNDTNKTRLNTAAAPKRYYGSENYSNPFAITGTITGGYNTGTYYPTYPAQPVNENTPKTYSISIEHDPINHLWTYLTYDSVSVRDEDLLLLDAAYGV